MTTVLVTGGAGFIGSHLVDALVQRGHVVRVLDTFDVQVHGSTRPDYLNPTVEYLEGDVRDRAMLRRALCGIDVVFHEAAAVGVGQSMYEIERYVSANVLGTATLLDVIVNDRVPIKKLIVASSMSIYGEGQYRCAQCGPVAPPLRSPQQLAAREWEMRCPTCERQATPAPTSEAKPLIPTSVYAVTKRDQEELCLTVGRSYGLPTVALRYFNVYGPRQALSNPYTGVCAIFSARIKHRRRPIVFEDGAQTRDFTHVRDIIQANLLAMTDARADYQALNVGTGRAVSIGEIGRLLAELYEGTPPPNGGDGEARGGPPPARGPVTPQLTGKFRAGDIRHCYADISAIRALGFTPSVTLEDGLRELVEWGKAVAAEDRVEAAAKELEIRGLTGG